MKNIKKDIILIISLLFISFILMFFNKFLNNEGDSVQIFLDNKLYKELPLSVDAQIKVGNSNIVVIENGCAYMKYATCPDKICIKQGKIHNSSRDIVCLPNKVLVKVTKKSKVDVISN